MNKGGFSWKRLSGYTKHKTRISRATGVPFTKSGRNQKIGRKINPENSGGCLAFLMIIASSLLTVGVLFLIY